RPFAALADDINDTSHGVGSVERALRAARNFDVIYAVDAEGGEIKIATELIQLDPVDHDEVVVGVAASNEDAGYTTVPAGLADIDAGDFAQRFVNVLHTLVFDVLFGDDANGGADLRREHSARRRGDYDVFFDGAYLQMKVNSTVFAGSKIDARGKGGEARDIRDQRVGAGQQAFETELARGVGVAIVDGIQAGEEIDAGAGNDTTVGVENFAAESSMILCER